MKKKKWLWAAAVLVIAGACGACKGGTGDESPAATDRLEAAAQGQGETAEAPVTESGEQERDGKESPETAADEEQGGFTTGTWDGLTFHNPWLGVSIPFPEGSKIFSEEEMRQLVGTSEEIQVNSGDFEDIREKVSRALNIYDLMATLPDGRSSLQLAYMNAKMADPTREITAADCLEEMARELSAIGDMGYEVSPMEKKEIGGKIFDGFSASLMGGALYQEYYGIRVGDYVAILTVSYEGSGKEAVEAVIRGIESL